MARADGRRQVAVWLSPVEWAQVEAAAAEAGVASGALLREAAMWNLALVAREVSAGRVRLRARSSRVPVPAAAASEASGEQVPGAGSSFGAASVRGSSSRPASQKRPEDGAVLDGVDSKIVPVPRRPAVDRVAAFRAATQRGVS